MRRRLAERQAKLITWWQQTGIADLLYRLRMRGLCPHPPHRMVRLDDHGDVFDYCQDCREVVPNGVG